MSPLFAIAITTEILSAVWDYAFDPGSNVLNVYVRYLRSKIDRAGEPSLITTVRGVGYRFDRHADVVIRFGHGTPSPDRF